MPDQVHDFLLELRCEEIPARMQAGARTSLERLFREQMTAAGVAHGELTVWSTPRRLALIARRLPEATAALREELKGPRVGAPPAALDGFLRKTGLSRDQLEERGGTYYAITEKPGRAMIEVLAVAIPAIVRAFPWPKSMRWGAASFSAESLRWVRPLSGIVAILGEDLVACEIGGILSSYATLGHRFHHPGPITVGGADDYQEKLRACHVVVDHNEREALIRERAAAAAAEAGLTLVADEGLVAENAGLTEWPVPLLGRFDEAFLEVPPEVIQLTARTNQKYFVCQDGSGRLANAFVCTANIDAVDEGAAIVAGNRKVLAARLADARFFWEQDRRKTLAEHATKLGNIVFHEKLGTVADKVERVAKLARWLVEEGIVRGADPDLAEQAARLCKADLVTEMVGEFPELQGVVGGYYARAEGLPEQIAGAIGDHYKPVGQGDTVPTAPVTVAVSLADKLDTLITFFYEGMRPTGSGDPFALRRAVAGTIRILIRNSLRLPLTRLFNSRIASFAGYQAGQEDALAIADMLKARRAAGYNVAEQDYEDAKAVALQRAMTRRRPEELRDRVAPTASNLLAFFADRLKVQQREAGVRHDLIDAVFALGGEDDLVRLLSRVQALQAFVARDDGANLLVAYKRAANILKKEGFGAGPPAAPAPDDDTGRTLGTGDNAPPLPVTGEEDPLVLVDDPLLRGVAAEFFRAEQQPHQQPLSYPPEPAEAALIAALDASEPRARQAVEAEDFAGAMAALAALRGPIDAFFDQVTVNDPDPARRGARLALLARFRDAVHQVADFSRIEG